MLEDDFLKEKQNIRQKMLKYSRTMSGKEPMDSDFREEFSSDDILRRRFKNKKSRKAYEFDDYDDEVKSNRKENIYLKEDLINVKLEEKQSLAHKILTKLKEKKKKNEKIEKKNEKTQKKILNFFSKSSPKNKQESNKIPAKKEANKQQNLNNEKTTPKQEKEPTKLQPTKEKSVKISNDISLKETDTKNKILKTEIAETKSPSSINLQNEDSEKTKNVLLEGFSNATKEDKNLSFHHLLFVALFMAFILVLFIPQIYIRNHIYYLSREIGTLRVEESVLNEENKDLKRRLENMRFQNQILDYLE